MKNPDAGEFTETIVPLERTPQAAPSAARLLVMDVVHWQATGEQPVPREHTGVSLLASPADPCMRTITAEEQWQPLCGVSGWIDDPGLMVLSNVEGRFTQRVPSADEREAAEARIVEVGLMVGADIEPFEEVRPGLSARLWPTAASFKRLFFRCRTTTARFQAEFYAR